MSAEANKEDTTNPTDNPVQHNGDIKENKVKENIEENGHVKKKSDDDKNIHVPKDKKLKIEYVSVKNAFNHDDIVFYDIHVKTSQHYWHVTKR